jgi:NADPH:quinone reductase
MRAMQAAETGAALRMAETPRPEPGRGEVLLRVRACGINFADTLMVAGRYQEKPPFPLTPGLEVCGVVEAIGPGAVGVAVGQRVAALCGHGGLADYATAPAGACAVVPDAMDDVTAAALQVAYGTSHLALGHRARLRPGERLVVTGAAGGVGLTAIEIGKLMGAEVVAVARGPDKLAVAKEKGADHLAEADPEALLRMVKGLGGADVVYDAVGGELWKAALRACNPEARLIPVGFASGEVPQIPANILLVKNLTVIGLYWGAYRAFAPQVLGDSLRTILGWWAEGRIVPHVSHVLPLEEAEAALGLLRDRSATGKVVVRIG